ncbi:Plant non-specific lipid-transfer protein/Par allergen protein [Dioscorea alata]|uniref:Plant non-specific lipid-transfer protein/Par allergen protein n=1 Tax=Dioscorea alata TaxID=55571 RepID=A0ACB7VI38_DIOAL|nr:Plant non-specific lipid-transfer protein/Par allergen protein [Dioscorea alata]
MKTSIITTKTTICTLLLLLLFFTSLNFSSAAATVTCNTITTEAAPCLGFITGTVPSPPAVCCSGLKQIVNSGTTVTDRRAICQCMKNAIKEFPGVKEKFLSQLPKSCHVSVSFPISSHTNCNTVH